MDTASKRFITIAEYQRQTGLSYATVRHMLATGQLNYITTECGHEKIDTKDHTDASLIFKRLDRLEDIVRAIAEQFHTPLQDKAAGLEDRIDGIRRIKKTS